MSRRRRFFASSSAERHLTPDNVIAVSEDNSVVTQFVQLSVYPLRCLVAEILPNSDSLSFFLIFKQLVMFYCGEKDTSAAAGTHRSGAEESCVFSSPLPDPPPSDKRIV